MKISRRKFDVLVKFLRQTIASESIKHSVRMQAAVRLDDLLARELHYAERVAARKERAEIRAAAGREQEGSKEAQQSASHDVAETETEADVQKYFEAFSRKPDAEQA